VEVVASLSQGCTAAAQCGLFTYKSAPVIFEPPCISLRETLRKMIIVYLSDCFINPKRSGGYRMDAMSNTKLRISSDALVHSLRFSQNRATISIYSFQRMPLPIVAVLFVRYKLNLYIRFRLITDFNRLKVTSQILNDPTYITALQVYLLIISNLFLLSFYEDLIETFYYCNMQNN